jgi:hypothetical protein
MKIGLKRFTGIGFGAFRAIWQKVNGCPPAPVVVSN